MKQTDKDLLTDLARLTRRYPPEAWLSILDWLEDETRRRQLSSLMRELADLSKEAAPRAKRSAKAPGIARLLSDVQMSDPAKGDLLQEFWRGLLTRDLLPTVGSIRIFAETAGLKPPTTKQREQAANDIMRQLCLLPKGAIQAILEATATTARDFGNDYEQWVSVILGRSAKASDAT